MIYLIGQLAGWLLLAALFAALAGWAFAAQQAAPAEAAMRRDRAKLLRDLTALATGERKTERDDSEMLAARRLAELNGGRVTELEQMLAAARARADDATSRVAELERELERRGEEELRRAAAERAREIEVEPEPSQDDAALQAWRLRYFEQRVRYLETQPRGLAAPAPPPEAPVDHSYEWRAREAEARADYLAGEVRALQAVPVAAESEEAESPFASNADVDTLLRWRLLYLERRVAHLQAQREIAPVPPVAVIDDNAPDPDRWKWRARYLEARVRHLETREPLAPPAPQPIAAPIEAAPAEPTPAPTVATVVRRKPLVLPAARNGAPDDFTLIDGVSLQQQSTLYSLGVFHFDQIAAWSPENVAWVDQYLRLRGRIDQEEWVEQAADLDRDGPQAARRIVDSEDA